MVARVGPVGIPGCWGGALGVLVVWVVLVANLVGAARVGLVVTQG